jgi:hypothetical protein
VSRRARRPLVALLAVLLLAACQVRTEVAVDVAEDGSGTVTVSVGLDPDAASRFPRLADDLRVDDLEATGWTVTGPAVEDDGFSWVRATKPFSTPEQAGAVLAEIAGAEGPFRDFAVTRERSFARTEYGFSGVVDFSSEGLAAFSDEALTEALDGEPLGESVAAIETRIGAAIDDAFTFRVAVGLPGEVESNAPTSASNGAVWEPRLSEGRAITLEATSEEVRTRTLGFVAAAAVGALAVLVVGIVVPVRRARRRRALKPRGRHGVAAGG